MDDFPEALRESYTPGQLLGRGTSGSVYRARDLASGREVALKVLTKTASSEGAARFRQEAEILATLEHPNICKLEGWGRVGGRLWLALELFEGRTLRKTLEEDGRFTSGQVVLFLAAQVASGLEHAHRRGILHRDIKPENIFLAKDPVRGERSGGVVAKILDFGLAKALQGSSSSVRTKAGMILGTPAYMPPERVRGAAATPATDVYSLAIVVYEMLAGVPPFHGKPVDVLRAQLSGSPPRLDGAVPAEIEDAVREGLAKEPGDRPEGPRAFAEGLAAAAKRAVGRRRMEESMAPEARSPLAPPAADRSDAATPPARPGVRGEEATPPARPAAAPSGNTPPATQVVKSLSASADIPEAGRTTPLKASGSRGELEIPPLRQQDSDEMNVSRLDIPEAPTPTRRMHKGEMARKTGAILSRALTRMTLLSPQVRPFVMGGALAIVGIWGVVTLLRPPPQPYRPVSVEIIPGVTGARIEWTTATERVAPALVLPQGERPPARLTAGRERPSLKHVREVSSLRKGTIYTLWLADPSGVPHPVESFPTASEFKLKKVTVDWDGPLRVRLEGSPAFEATFERRVGGDLARIQVERLPPPRAVLPRLRVRTHGGELVEVPEFTEKLLGAFAEGLRAVDPGQVAEGLLRAAGITALSGRPPDPDGQLARLAEGYLKEQREVDRLWLARPYFEGLLRDPSLPASAKLEFARFLARFAILDALLEALGLQDSRGNATGAGRDRDSLTRSLGTLFFDVSPARTFRRETNEPPEEALVEWFPTDDNNLAPVGMSKEKIEAYHSKQKAFFSNERPPRKERRMEFRVPDGAPLEAPELGVISRASHPETVLFLLVNGQVLVPVRWHEEDGAPRAEAIFQLMTTMTVDKVVPLVTRAVRLPPGVIHPGVNEVRIWVENPLENPDTWLPTVHGVYLLPAAR